MQEEHKDSLQRNYVRLVRETPVDVVIDHLYQSGILTDELKEDILQQTNSYSKTRQLISILQRRGSEAFDCFCTALAMEGKSNLVNLLKCSVTDADGGSKNRCMQSIGGDIFIVANEWCDKLMIHIRKNEKKSANTYIPTKKGVALNLSQWVLLEMYVNDIDNAIGKMIDDVDGNPEMTFHLGKGAVARRMILLGLVSILHALLSRAIMLLMASKFTMLEFTKFRVNPFTLQVSDVKVRYA
ncbi:uncharacterized protein LOC134717743 [Mytilus trossulus]|uniref:uncharacterized protein LOC134717743 n=1 Tax=Mytilus trossulus TaxID=6551 RepID=UPI003004BAED